MEVLLTALRSMSPYLSIAGEDDLVDVVVEDENFDVLLLVDLEQRRGAEQGLGAAGDVVDALLVRPSCAT